MEANSTKMSQVISILVTALIFTPMRGCMVDVSPALLSSLNNQQTRETCEPEEKHVTGLLISFLVSFLTSPVLLPWIVNGMGSLPPFEYEISKFT